MRFFSLTLAVLVMLPGVIVDAPPASAATGRITLDVAGEKRSFLLMEFERLKRSPRTVIIVLRANGPRARMSSTDRRGIGLSAVVRNAGVTIVYPDAIENRWNLEGSGANDVAFVRAIATKLVADGVADRRRIFIAGVSSGGILAMKIACEGADYVAGFAFMIAAMPANMAPACKPAKPVSVLLMNGTADPLVPYQGGMANLNGFNGNVVSTEATLAPFLTTAGCSGERTSSELPDRDPKDGSRVVLEHYPNCKPMIELMRIQGGGHTLPGRPAREDRGAAVGAQNNDVSTPRVIWDFVRRATR